MECSDIGKLIRGKIIDLAQDKKGPRGLQIVICDNPTNGDMIKAMFNCMVIEISKGKVYVEGIYFPFDEEWWNAPYKPKGE